ncbi:unnamed protein product [Paramecium sonneborni]|uniref:Reverse transcriptase domain-containing protein n=1 Tax=Paramecium sonneborni TaxID=65129 RepID=A0A8S1QHF4_9CILI|nr:unnamed protein product [Paramecium sonneborni]
MEDYLIVSSTINISCVQDNEFSTAAYKCLKSYQTSFNINLKQLNYLNCLKKKLQNFRISFNGTTHQFIQKCVWRILNDLQNQQTFNILLVAEKNIHINIFILIEQIRQQKQSGNQCLIFIDFTSAYNTVKRQKLQNSLRIRQILNDIETQFLELIHSKILYYTFPQGSQISSTLSNIYLDEFINGLLQRDQLNFKFLGYADDLVLITDKCNLGTLTVQFMVPKCQQQIQWHTANKIRNEMHTYMQLSNSQQLQIPWQRNQLQRFRFNTYSEFCYQNQLYPIQTAIHLIQYELPPRLFLNRLYIGSYFIYIPASSSFNKEILSNNIIKFKKKMCNKMLRLPSNKADTLLNLFLQNYYATILDSLHNYSSSFIVYIIQLQTQEQDTQNNLPSIKLLSIHI